MSDVFEPMAVRQPGKSRKRAERTEEMEAAADTTSAAQTVAAGQLRAFVERIERLEEEKKTVGEDIRDVYAELKGVGFDPKAVRAIVKLRKMDEAERQERESILDLYKSALGMA